MQPRFFFILLLFNYTFVNGQFLKKVRYDLGVGIGVSVSQSKLETKESTINPWSVQYYRSERYKFPSFRMRGSALHQVSTELNFGVRSGVDVIYLERNAYGELETYFAVPTEIISN